GIPERAGLECDQRLDRAGAVDPGAVALLFCLTGNVLYRLASLEQDTAGDLHAAVGLLLQRVQRLPRLAIGIDDVNALRDLAVRHLRLAKFETLVTIDRGVSLLDQAEKDIGSRENALDCGGGIGIGRGRIVAAERVNLGADDALRSGHIVAGPG